MRHVLLLTSLLTTSTGCYGLLASALQGDDDTAHARDDSPRQLEAVLASRDAQLSLPDSASRTAVEVAPMRPDWCDGFVADPTPMKFDLGTRLAVSPQFDELVFIARAACERPDDAGRQAVVAATRGTYLAYFGITEVEDHAHLAARAAIRDDYDWDAACKGITPAQAATSAGAALQVLYECEGRGGLFQLDADLDDDPVVALAARNEYARMTNPLVATALARAEGTPRAARCSLTSVASDLT